MARSERADPGPESRFAPLDDSDIQAQTDSGSFSRGRSYFRDGHIHSGVLRQDTLEALCEGSDPEPYRVRATLLRAGEVGDIPRTATCPVEGMCKHIVAMLLAWIDDPSQFVPRAPVTERLAGRSAGEFIALVSLMVEQHPDLEAFLDLPITTGETVSTATTCAEISPDAIRKQVQTVIATGLRNVDDWDTASRVATTLQPWLDAGKKLAIGARWADAQEVFTILIEELGPRLLEFDDDAGALDEIIAGCDSGLATCLDAQQVVPESQRLSPESRGRLIRTCTIFGISMTSNLAGSDCRRRARGPLPTM